MSYLINVFAPYSGAFHIRLSTGSQSGLLIVQKSLSFIASPLQKDFRDVAMPMSRLEPYQGTVDVVKLAFHSGILPSVDQSPVE